MGLADDSARYYLTLGIGAVKDGAQDEARGYLERVLRMEPRHEFRVQALLWLSETSEDPAVRRGYLEQALAYDPANPAVRRGLAILDGHLKAEEILGPHAPRAEPEAAEAERTPEAARSRRFVCQSCGGTMQFDPSYSRLRCQYCGASMTELEAIQSGSMVTDGDFVAVLSTASGHRWQRPSYSIKCEGCGAEVVLPEGQISQECPFCGSPHVVQTEGDPDVIQPHAMIPFGITEEEAMARFRAWLGKGWFRPRDLAEQARSGKPRPIYLPFWSFDFMGNLSWRATVEESDRNWVPRSDLVPILEHNVLVPATHSVPAGPLRVLDEFNLEELEPFAPEKLAAWPAEVYRISMADASMVARQRISEKGRERILSGYLGGRQYRDLVVATDTLAIDRFQHILLPVWVLTYHYRGELYYVLVNGQTGEVEGEAPDNRWMYVLVAALAISVVAVFTLLVYLLTRGGLI